MAIGKLWVWTLFWVYPGSKGGHDFIMVILDQFSKMAHFIPWHKSHNASYITCFHFKESIKLHGVTKSIVFDWDTRFCLSLNLRIVGTKLLLSTTCGPQNNEWMEVINQTLSISLESLVGKNMKEWDIKPSHSEFSYNQASAYGTSNSPF